MAYSISHNPSKPGLNSPASYQISAIPWVTSSVAPAAGAEPAVISFYNVTDFVVIKNTNETEVSLKVGFSKNGLENNNYFILEQNESFSADLRVTDLYLVSNSEESVNFTIISGLTSVERAEIPNNWSGSAGIG